MPHAMVYSPLSGAVVGEGHSVRQPATVQTSRHTPQLLTTTLPCGALALARNAQLAARASNIMNIPIKHSVARIIGPLSWPVRWQSLHE